MNKKNHMKSNMHIIASLDMAVRVVLERMVTTQTSSSQPLLGSQRPGCPSGRMKQQLCGTYTREAHTVGARMGEKGAHDKGGAHVGRNKEGHARQGRHARHRRRARQRGAQTTKEGAHGNREVHTWGAHGNGRCARQRRARMVKGVRTAKGRVRTRF
jgi:hypothetical protein